MLDENHVTTLIWAVSALCLLNRLHGLKHKVPADINKILFSGEAMPIRQLHAWQSYYPDAMFVNLYGPTEITCNCTYHILDRAYSEDEKLPIGIPFPNERVFLLDEENHLIEPGSIGKTGELCVAGTTLALGYYRNAAATVKAFVANPLQTDYPETIYRTGDLASYGEDGLLYFAGRKDFQIKHMGHRIELEEIEHALAVIPEIEGAACFYDREKNKVVACYIGIDDKKYLITAMKKRCRITWCQMYFARWTCCHSTKWQDGQEAFGGTVQGRSVCMNTEALRTVAATYGTPTYIFDVREVEARIRLLRSLLPEDTGLCFAVKQIHF